MQEISTPIPTRETMAAGEKLIDLRAECDRLQALVGSLLRLALARLQPSTAPASRPPRPPEVSHF